MGDAVVDEGRGLLFFVANVAGTGHAENTVNKDDFVKSRKREGEIASDDGYAFIGGKEGGLFRRGVTRTT